MTTFNLNTRSAGVLLHITSLPGPHGVGDLGPHAYRFVDWLAASGQRIWQLLPTNPIGPGDSPYQSVSAFAGSPLMVALEPLVDAGWLNPPDAPSDGWDAARVDFATVIPWRITQLRSAAQGYLAQASANLQEEFANWCVRQSYWLDDYALFMALERAHGGRPWWEWNVQIRERQSTAMEQARKEHAEEIFFWEFVQWCFDTQISALKAYAHRKDVALVGDLPIFIAHHSADCWARPDHYALDADFQPTVVAGVPPDDLAPDGQRWGNPLYQWDRMAQEGFAWWTSRVRRALELADVFRIDHFRGFAGYYEIPSSSPTARVGRWVAAPGIELFETIRAELGELPIIAEDLGLITPDVIALRDGCGFPGMKIFQFAFGNDGAHEFLPHNYSNAFIAYTGTHDNDTVHGWWATANARERAYALQYLGCTQEQLHWGMIRALCNSVAAVVVFPLQDVLGLDGAHRMNIPGTLGGINWTWRFQWDMVDALHGETLGQIAAASGRAPMALLNLPPQATAVASTST